MQIKSYSKSQVAQAYFPCATSGAALNLLASWIRRNRQLSEALAATGYRSTQRILSSRQVALIFEFLGEP